MSELKEAIEVLDSLTTIRKEWSVIRDKFDIPYSDDICKHDNYEYDCRKCKQEQCEKHDYMPVTCHNDTEYICRWCGKDKDE